MKQDVIDKKLADNNWEYKYLTDLIIKPKFVANAIPSRDKNIKYSALTMKIMDLMYQNINNQVYKESYSYDELGDLYFTYDADDLLASLGSDSNLTITRLNKEITKIMGRIFSYQIGDTIINECIIPYSELHVKSRMIKYKLSDNAKISVLNGYINPTEDKNSKSNYVIYDKTKIFSKKFSQSTNILFRLLHTNKNTIMNGKYIVGRDLIRELFGASYDKIALEERRFFDDAIEELSSIGLIVLYKRVYSNLSNTRFKGWKFAVFYDKNKHIKTENIEDWAYFCKDYDDIIKDFDKGFNVLQLSEAIADETESEVNTIMMKEESTPKNLIKGDNVEYVHFDNEGSKYMLNGIIDCFNKNEVISLIINSKNYNVYCQNFLDNTKETYRDNIVNEEKFKNGYRFRKIKEEEERIIF
jgi:hypothetical protein